jgi:protein-S-isoprenylcysteine O-methyltransferase Ste14
VNTWLPLALSMKSNDHPAVYVPPPLIYVAFFFFSLLLQKLSPFDNQWLKTRGATLTAGMLILLCVLLCVPALWRFTVSKNTLITIKPARSLQTTRIYAFSRNPMYLGLLLLYCGIGVFKGNWWTFVLVPLLVMILQVYVIKKEENYLQNAFGEEYNRYKKKVRRWL